MHPKSPHRTSAGNQTAGPRTPLRKDCGFAILFAALGTTASGQFTWDGGGLDNNWSSALNWSLNAAPLNLATEIIRFSGSTRLTPNADGAKTMLGLMFDSGASSFTLGGSDLTTATGGIANSSANLQTIDNAITAAGIQTWNASAGDLVIGGNVGTGGFPITLAAGSGKQLTLSGTVSGTGSLVVNSTGTVLLSGNNTHSGGTVLTAGTLGLGHNAAAGTGTLSLNGGSIQASGSRTLDNDVTVGGNFGIGGSSDLTLNGSINLGLLGSRSVTVTNSGTTTFAGVVSGTTSSLEKAGSGTLVLSGSNTFAGGLTVSAGTLTLSGSLASGNALVVNGGTLRLTSFAQTLKSLAGSGGTIEFGSGHALTLAQVTATSYSGILTGPGSLTLNGSGGTLTLSGGSDANTSSDGVNVNEGTLVLSKSAGTNAIAGGTVTVGNGTGTDRLQWGASNQIGDAAALRLGGGILLLNGFSESFSTSLQLTANSTIDFGSASSSLAFGDSSGTSWDGNTLTITNYVAGSSSLRFGSNASGLTASQLALVRFAGFGDATGQISASGYVTPVPEPVAVAAIAGIAAIALRMLRRREKRP